MTHAGKKVNWAHIREVMPTDRSDASKHKCMQLHAQFDPNGNNYLSPKSTRVSATSCSSTNYSK